MFGQSVLKTRSESPQFARVTITLSPRAVTVAYLNQSGVAQDVREFSTKENPELATIARPDSFGEPVWDMDMVLAVLDAVEPDEPIDCALTPEAAELLKVAS